MPAIPKFGSPVNAFNFPRQKDPTPRTSFDHRFVPGSSALRSAQLIPFGAASNQKGISRHGKGWRWWRLRLWLHEGPVENYIRVEILTPFWCHLRGEGHECTAAAARWICHRTSALQKMIVGCVAALDLSLYMTTRDAMNLPSGLFEH